MTQVVVTGIGAVTPLGVGARTLHERWLAGQSGIEDGEGKASEYEPKEHLSVKEARRADRFTQFAMVAGDEALAEAGWSDELPYDPTRIACIIGTGIGGIGTLEHNHDVLRDSGPKKVSPLSVPLMMSNAAPGALSMRYGLRGHSYGIVSACAAGAHAIGNSANLIQMGMADAVVTGGSEAALTPLSKAAFAALDALSELGISRPFDARRDGFVMGEGAAVLVLEDAEKAKARGATILATIKGYGASSDAHHITAPQAEGRGAAQAIAQALETAGVKPEDVDYVNAHGTSTPLNDRAETKAIKLALGDHAGGDPGVLDEVGDRAPARRRRRRRGRRHHARAARRGGPADARLGGARGGHGPRLRAERGPAPGERPAAHRDLQLVRVRRPQRRAVPGGGMSARLARSSPSDHEPAVATTAGSAASAARALCDPGSLPSSARTSCPSGWARRRARATASSPAPAASTAGPCSASRRTRRSPAARSARRTPRRSSASCGSPAARACPSSASSSPAARACRRASPRSTATGASSASTSRSPAGSRRSP